jgi:chloramphenicol 3-O-phosphotransferase
MSNEGRLESGSMFLVTGPMASGKSTVAASLAAAFERGVHLEGDVFRRSIVAGREEVTPEAGAEALAQLRLRYRLTALAAHEYVRFGFTVAIEDVVAGPMLSEFVRLVDYRPLHVVVLLPSEEVIARREAARATVGYGRWTVPDLYRLFVDETERVGLWLDTSEQTPKETVSEILSRADEASLG